MKSPISLKREPKILFTLPNLVYGLVGFSALYILVAQLHIGNNMRGFVSPMGANSFSGGMSDGHHNELHEAIQNLEVEHKRLQDLVKQSEALVSKEKTLLGAHGHGIQQHQASAPVLTTNSPPAAHTKTVTSGSIITHSHTHSIDAKKQVMKDIAKSAAQQQEKKEHQVVDVPAPAKAAQKDEPPVVVKQQQQQQQQQHSSSGEEDDPGKLYSRSYVLDSTVSSGAQGTKERSKESKAMMVVCGTDGSGTRRVVQTLTKLGVLMTSEDPETYDIHGDLMGGWPEVVKPLLAVTHTLDYDPTKIDAGVHQRISGSLRRLVTKAEQDSHKPESHKLAVGGALPRKNGADASRVAFGFKAPVAMTLAPYWAHLSPKFKLLHVVRDGRDISFSANQGPVQKFYKEMYGGGSADNKLKAARSDQRVKAIQLWSDWNSQIREWSERMAETIRHEQEGGGNGGGKSYSYMSFQTEDLVSENVQVRYRAITDLAQWVGSSLGQEAICCIAQEDAQFMGSHDRTQRARVKNQAAEVSKRYGKWRGLAKNNKGLLDSFERIGGPALKLFGYEGAPAAAATTDVVPVRGYVCPNSATTQSMQRCSKLV